MTPLTVSSLFMSCQNFFLVHRVFAGAAPCFGLSGVPWLSLPKNPNFVFRDSPAGKIDRNLTKIFYFCSGHQNDPERTELGGTCGLQFGRLQHRERSSRRIGQGEKREAGEKGDIV